MLREYYYVRKEDTCATGRADITYTPKDSSHMPIVIELKADDSVDNAIRQMKERDYSDVFKGCKGKVLLLGIAYDSKSLKHDSKIEYIELWRLWNRWCDRFWPTDFAKTKILFCMCQKI